MFEQKNILVILIHGLGTDKKDSRMKKFEKEFWNRNHFNCFYCIEHYYYGKWWIHDAYRKNIQAAKKLANRINKADAYDKIVVIAHSNGCAIVEAADTYLTRSIDSLVYCHPAVRRDKVPNRAKSIHVFYSPYDLIIAFLNNRFVRIIPFLFSNVTWGDMGLVGYHGKDKRVQNYRMEKHDFNSFEAHSMIFHKFNLYGKTAIAKIETDLFS